VRRSGRDGGLLEEADDHREERPDEGREDAGAGVVGVAAEQPAECRDQHGQHLAADTAAHDAEHGVEHRAEVPVLEKGPDDVATGAAGDEAHDPADDLGIHG
jgi:hypothetical protein